MKVHESNVLKQVRHKSGEEFLLNLFSNASKGNKDGSCILVNTKLLFYN